ncbi:rhodanese-like domain-containing protein [Alkalicoccus halolimnae]|uniref:Rhodanese-like domain-containing protein n=1 Tax=Alkalicoccus halolimnae TaxID=1667239 RepID=A0A5C7FL36_9BACI|nr:rhodanese-like domain-containing protein [Alkalicoccus halolimnae]TXF86809.1 rhodanese-like domain-containing protein [Alkalicoccus halolimnae]
MEILISVIIAAVILISWNKFSSRGINSISTEELKGKLEERRSQYVDVRTPAEFKNNHIRPFKNLPLHQLGSKSEKLSKEEEVILICQSGMRSSRGAKMLKKKGFTKVTNVKGGMNAWK